MMQRLSSRSLVVPSSPPEEIIHENINNENDPIIDTDDDDIIDPDDDDPESSPPPMKKVESNHFIGRPKQWKSRQGSGVVTFVEVTTSDNSNTSASEQQQQQQSKSHGPLELRAPEKPGLTRQLSQDDYEASASQSSSAGSAVRLHWNTTRNIMALILILSGGTVAAFLSIGIGGAKDREEEDFHRDSQDLVLRIQSSWNDYVHAANLVHAACRDRSFTRPKFRQLYEYLLSNGLDFKAVQFDPYVTAEERWPMEAEARAYYAEHYPHVNYQGFRGFEPGIPGLSPRSNQSFYYPIHYQEPIPGNEAAIDLDYYSSASRRETVNFVLQKGLPAVTPRLLLVKTPGAVNRCTPDDRDAYGVVLMHPGVNLTEQPDVWPHEFSSIVICMPQLLFSAVDGLSVGLAMYIHDASDPETAFLGGLRAKDPTNGGLELLDELSIDDLNGRLDLYHRQNVMVANRVWTITVVPISGTYQPVIIFVILGGVLIFFAGVFLALWVYSNTSRWTKLNKLKAQSEAEKAQLILDNARKATRAERELNDFIAHEVRNPVAAAMAACSFIKTAVHKDPPLEDAASQQSCREDVAVIEGSLKFVNDLLRSMLDMHRAASKQLKVDLQAVDLLHDVLEPVHAMLHHKRDRVALSIHCDPPNLHVITDPLRLKQVMLNLGRNSAKFVMEGFIRLQAVVVDGHVQLYVDDSGPGIPAEKRERLFSKFQESLDQLSQGTGIGLFLCKSLVELMGGEISLDDNYDSGIPGHPGTRFVVNLQSPPIEAPAVPADLEMGGQSQTSLHENHDELPATLNVLLVDDDAMIRKMFSRAIAKVAPGWVFRQAASGEAALQITETEEFDLIFMDMYMASVEKQLLGTETVAELRSRGIKSRICGLSANDKEYEFLEAGADAFTFKPFPCAPAPLTKELLRVLYG